jgi:hypothetical protein
MSAHKIQTPGNHPQENIQHSQHGECVKSSFNQLQEIKKNKYAVCQPVD